ncbi:MAG: nucleotidyltransferase domain-containing protein [Candidatus Binatia bacterium]
MNRSEVPRSLQQALAEMKQALSGLYGEQLRGLYLYGSYARGTAHEGSDVDVLVVLADPIKPGAEITRMNPVISAICLRYDILISLYPVSAQGLETRRNPFLENVCNEAVPL